jgi:membrane protease YdiL (CAAX protease family)
MKDYSSNNSARKKIASFFYENKIGLSVIILIILAIILIIPPLGVLFAFIIVAFLVLLAIKEGSLSDIGFRSLKSWPKAIFLSFILAILIELTFQVFFNPIFEAITDTSIDLSEFEGMRGNFITYIIMLLIGWVVGGFIEEITFRGYLITRLKKLLGKSPLVLFFILVLTSAPFGLSHLYQGLSGVLSTGFIGFIFGFIFIKKGYNLWLPILTHGFVNMVGFTLIYLDLDTYLRNIL